MAWVQGSGEQVSAHGYGGHIMSDTVMVGAEAKMGDRRRHTYQPWAYRTKIGGYKAAVSGTGDTQGKQ